MIASARSLCHSRSKALFGILHSASHTGYRGLHTRARSSIPCSVHTPHVASVVKSRFALLPGVALLPGGRALWCACTAKESLRGL